MRGNYEIRIGSGEELERMVGSAREQGWSLHGPLVFLGMSQTNHMVAEPVMLFAQAMTKEVQDVQDRDAGGGPAEGGATPRPAGVPTTSEERAAKEERPAAEGVALAAAGLGDSDAGERESGLGDAAGECVQDGALEDEGSQGAGGGRRVNLLGPVGRTQLGLQQVRFTDARGERCSLTQGLVSDELLLERMAFDKPLVERLTQTFDHWIRTGAFN